MGLLAVVSAPEGDKELFHALVGGRLAYLHHDQWLLLAGGPWLGFHHSSSAATSTAKAATPSPSPGNILRTLAFLLMAGAYLHASKRAQGSFNCCIPNIIGGLYNYYGGSN